MAKSGKLAKILSLLGLLVGAAVIGYGMTFIGPDPIHYGSAKAQMLLVVGGIIFTAGLSYFITFLGIRLSNPK